MFFSLILNLRRLESVLAIAAFLTTPVLCARGAEDSQQTPSHPPNIVIIFIDDMGYADIGPFGATAYKTPHLDRMAKEGRVFTDFHAATAVCSASRAGLMTGCYPERVSILGALSWSAKTGISDKEMTLAQLCKTRGYATAIFGKWHLGHHKQFCHCNTALTNTSVCPTRTTCHRCRPK